MTKTNNTRWATFFTLFLIVVLGAYLRFIGQNWDQNYHLHPDERFLTMVETSIRSVPWKEFFNTSVSNLNPHNRGFTFYVYGTFPLFLVRYVAEILEKTSYDQIHLIGRTAAALFDIGTIILVFLIANQISKSKLAGLIGAAFYSFAALPIQQAHFFTVDLFGVFFTTLAFFLVSKLRYVQNTNPEPGLLNSSRYDINIHAIFGISIGLAAASKINNVIFALLLPIAHTIQNPHWYKNKTTIKNTILFFITSALFFFITFRFAQPYAFAGPDFWGITPNLKWIDNLQELSILSSGNSNYPPSLQWARRDWLFAGRNLIVWGIGIPFGIALIIGFIKMGLRIVRSKGKDYLLLWSWSGGYFFWQSLAWNPTMRYFLPIYPLFAVIVAWFLFDTLQTMRNIKTVNTWNSIIKQIFIVLLLIMTIIGTAMWAFAFIRIYSQPMTRVAASDWIYRNLEGTFNLHFASEKPEFTQPLPYPHYYVWDGDFAFDISVNVDNEIKSTGLLFDHIVNVGLSNTPTTISVQIVAKDNSIIAKGKVTSTFLSENDPRGYSYNIEFENAPIRIEAGSYHIILIKDNPSIVLKLSGTLGFSGSQDNNSLSYYPIIDWAPAFRTGDSYKIDFSPLETASITKISIFRALDLENRKTNKNILLEVLHNGEVLSSGYLSSDFFAKQDYRGNSYTVDLNNDVELIEGQAYQLAISFLSGEGNLIFNGSLAAKETDWDDALPLYMYGYNPFDYQSGVFQSDLNFDMYTVEDSLKLARFERILAIADYIIISSNRQWGSTTQIPERYPLASAFYAGLLNCANYANIQNCYREAKVSPDIGVLGFKLVAAYQSDPGIGPFNFNSQYAEEAFTVYDHPKVMIFKKSKTFGENERKYLQKVDLGKVLNITPAESNHRPGILMLGEVEQKFRSEKGTWSDIFNSQALINTNQIFGIAVWYMFIALLGVCSYPLTRLIFHNHLYRGYEVSRLVGFLVLGVFAWYLGSAGFAITRTTLLIILAIWFLINALIAFYFHNDIKKDLKQTFKEILRIEVLFFSLFLLFLLIRVGNPDLWHPYKGGEKPMDFAYLNATIKSEFYPPHDPWFAGGYLNYYYLGFVLAAMPIKLLGIIPSIAYNLVLPTFFAFTGIAAYCVGKNVGFWAEKKGNHHSTWWFGIFAIVFVLLLGNLGTVKMIMDGFISLGSVGSSFNDGYVQFFQKVLWFVRGVINFAKGTNLPYYPGDWYWIPSRALPGEPITEFPFFTFLYGDPHAHLYSLPYTMLAICWSLNLFLNISKKLETSWFVLQLIAGAIIVGSLRVINTWDWPLQLIFACIAISYRAYLNPGLFGEYLNFARQNYRRIGRVLFSLAIFIFATYLASYPFITKYGQAYSSLEIWNGTRTPLSSYLTHWGVLLFFISSWLFWRIFLWLKTTRLSELKKWEPFKTSLVAIFIIALIALAYLLYLKVVISTLVFPLVLLGLGLIIFTDASLGEKITSAFAIVGLALTLFVELFVLRGDIGRMNTVFKFYLQSWIILGFAASFAFVTILSTFKKETTHSTPQILWAVISGFLFIGAGLYPLAASVDKITDRMNKEVRLTIDGMAYMANATYSMGDRIINLSGDYQAILWMQENISGSPVIMEANDIEYRWGNRFSIYTGLASVVGWNWHQRQQRAINPWEWVFERVEDVKAFYTTENVQQAWDILKKYKVAYVIVGELESALYPGSGLEKFTKNEKVLWQKIYQNKTTTIYKVLN